MNNAKPHNNNGPQRNDDRIIIHFDYDCFYASVFEAENPALRALPLAVQQKHIIVTCNYEARRRGLRKLQGIAEARQQCPDLVIVLGENLDRFRDASKSLYSHLAAFSWNRKVEKLGFDEVWMDVTDIVEYNKSLLNHSFLSTSFFHLSREDPTLGFEFDATRIAGHQYPDVRSHARQKGGGDESRGDTHADLTLRLILGSHLAQHLRHSLEEQKGYTSTVGISTSKLLSKLVGNLHKPKGQTTLMPPYSIPNAQPDFHESKDSNVTTFIDGHEVGKIPGIGFKTAQKLRKHISARTEGLDPVYVYDEVIDPVDVGTVRKHHDVSARFLEKLLGGAGAEKGIGGKIWELLWGVDASEVGVMRRMPTQISIEDSYIRLEGVERVRKELCILSGTLVRRMRIDLVEDDDRDEDDDDDEEEEKEDEAAEKKRKRKRWIAHPKTLRLSTRPRHSLPTNPTNPSDRSRHFNRISRSAPLPNFIFGLHQPVEFIVQKLVDEALMPMFQKLHPPAEKNFNLSLLNVAVTNMVEAASDGGGGGGGADGVRGGEGRDIGRMFRRQESVLRGFRVVDDGDGDGGGGGGGDEGAALSSTTATATATAPLVTNITPTSSNPPPVLKVNNQTLKNTTTPSIPIDSPTPLSIKHPHLKDGAKDAANGHELDSHEKGSEDATTSADADIVMAGTQEHDDHSHGQGRAVDFWDSDDGGEGGMNNEKEEEVEEEVEEDDEEKHGFGYEEEEEEEDDDDNGSRSDETSKCPLCGAVMPPFARAAHQRFHELGG